MIRSLIISKVRKETTASELRKETHSRKQKGSVEARAVLRYFEQEVSLNNLRKLAILL